MPEFRTVLSICALLVILPSGLQATFIDFETTPDGTVQTNNVYIGSTTYDSLGIHLRSEGSGFPKWRSGVYNGDGWFILGGPKYLGGSSWDKDHVGMDFLVACNSVSFDFMNNLGIQYWAYTPDGSLTGLGTVTNNGGWKTVTITPSSPDDLIARVEIKATTFDTVLAVDNIDFLPEPATLLLLATGGLILSRRCK